MKKPSFSDEIRVIIRPLDESIKVEEKRNDVVSVKQITPDDLIEIFAKSAQETKSVETGFLPENCLSVKIRDTKKRCPSGIRRCMPT